MSDELEALRRVYGHAASMRTFPVPFDQHYELVGLVDEARHVVENNRHENEVAELRDALREACDRLEARILVNPRLTREKYMVFDHARPDLEWIDEARRLAGEDKT